MFEGIPITTQNDSCDLPPATTLAGVVLAALTIYLLIRILIWIVAMVEAYGGGTEQRDRDTAAKKQLLIKPIRHCLIAGGLLWAYLQLGIHVGWLDCTVPAGF